MKLSKIFRIMGVTLVLSLLLAVVPAMPAAAANEITLSITSGKVGDSVTVSGTNFTASEVDNERYANVIFSADNTNTGTNMTSNVDTYKQVGGGFIGYTGDTDAGDFSATFTVPSELTDGTADATVAPGTYYIYITVSTSSAVGNYIYSKANFTVTPGATLNPLSPASGPSGSDVSVSGVNFPAGAITITLDGTPLTIKGGSVSTSGGSFISTVTIPANTTVAAHTLTVTVGSASATATYTVTASPSLDPLTPASGPAGTLVTIIGANFPVNMPLTFTFDQATITPTSGDTITRSSGTFITTIAVPEVAAGVHTVTAATTTGGATASQSFQVTASTTTTTTTTTETTPTTTTTTTTPPPAGANLAINANGHNIGADIGMSGSGFTPNRQVTISFDGQAVGTANADANGTILVVLKVPPIASGAHIISATDGASTGSTTFTIESDPPETPQPLKPEMEIKVKSPVTFTWEAAEDQEPQSLPLTYDLEIATSQTFSASSILVSKTDIDTITYELIPAEEAELDGPGPFYWRLRSVDAASNPSPWTGTGIFYASGSTSSFPSWALYTVMGVGAVLVFLIGYWLGRRSAFYY